MHKILPIIGLLLFPFVHTADAQTNWELRTDNDGIKIYTAIVAGSKIKAVKVECTFHSTLSQFVAVLMDIKGSEHWLYHTKSAVVVKQVSPSELYYYSEVNLPWPAENRDFVGHISVSQNPATKVVTLDGPAVPGFVPLKNGIVRIDHSGSQWVISPIGNGIIKVTYVLHVDPGGALPAWLINMFASEGPMQIFKNLKLQLQKPVYKTAIVPYIQN